MCKAVGVMDWRFLSSVALLSLLFSFTEPAAGFDCPPLSHREDADFIPLAGGDFFIPIFKHMPPGGKPRTAIIALHGAGRNGDNYYGWVENAMRKAGKESETLLAIPAFADESCSAAAWTGDSSKPGMAVLWSKSTRQWVYGRNSDSLGELPGISSFTVVDDLIEYLENSEPTLKRIVVTGFSAGAQFGLRWAIMSPMGIDGTTLSGRCEMKIIIGGPSSVAYLNNRRPAKSCNNIEDQSPDHNCSYFLAPKSSAAAEKSCNGNYNNYGFGLGGLEPEAARNSSTRRDVSKYILEYIKDEYAMESRIANHFITKDLHFAWGTTDTKDCIVGACADDCAAMITGTSRLQRGLNFIAHLKDAFPGYEPSYELYEGGHRPELFFATSIFNRAAFASEGWEACLWDSLTCWSLLVQRICAGATLLCILVACSINSCMRVRKPRRTESDSDDPESSFLESE